MDGGSRAVWRNLTPLLPVGFSYSANQQVTLGMKHVLPWVWHQIDGSYLQKNRYGKDLFRRPPVQYHVSLWGFSPNSTYGKSCVEIGHFPLKRVFGEQVWGARQDPKAVEKGKANKTKTGLVTETGLQMCKNFCKIRKKQKKPRGQVVRFSQGHLYPSSFLRSFELPKCKLHGKNPHLTLAKKRSAKGFRQ